MSAEQADRLPPHSDEAERGVLGNVFLQPADSMNLLLERRITPEMFYDLRHQNIFAVMLKLHDKKEFPVDIITVLQQLRDSGTLEDVGGLPYLAALPDATPAAYNVEFYARIVREKWVMRQVIRFCGEAVGKVFEHDGDADPLLASLLSGLEDVCQPMMGRTELTVREVLQQKVIPQLEEHYTRGRQHLRGLPTGIDYLDKVIRGIRKNYYVVIAGRPGGGKTSFALNVVEHVALRHEWSEVTDDAKVLAKARRAGAVITDLEDGKSSIVRRGMPVGVFTLEMSDDSLVQRLLFSVARVDNGSFEQGYATKSEQESVTNAVAKLAAGNIILDADSDQTIDMISAKARRWVKEYGIKLFVLDYLQLLDDDNDKFRNDRVQALRRISKKIVSLKNKLNVPWLVLAQMNRNIETAEVKRPPVLSDLKECGAIEQDADVVMFLYPPLKTENVEEQEDQIAQALPAEPWDRLPRPVNALVAKNRYGPTGKAKMLFQKNQCLFLDWQQWANANGANAKPEKGYRPAANPLAQIDPDDVPQNPIQEELT